MIAARRWRWRQLLPGARLRPLRPFAPVQRHLVTCHAGQASRRARRASDRGGRTFVGCVNCGLMCGSTPPQFPVIGGTPIMGMPCACNIMAPRACRQGDRLLGLVQSLATGYLSCECRDLFKAAGRGAEGGGLSRAQHLPASASSASAEGGGPILDSCRHSRHSSAVLSTL